MAHSVTVQAAGQTIVVNITGDHATVTVAGSPVSFPYTLTTDTTFVVPHGTYTVSCLIDGLETYGRTHNFSGGGESISIAPALTNQQLAAGDSATYAPLATPAWTANTPYVAHQQALNPSGNLIVRIASGTSRATYDATEIALWTTAGGGGSATPFTDKGAWATTTSYAVDDSVTQGGVRYVCKTAHTSSSAFATDKTADWVETGVSSASAAILDTTAADIASDVTTGTAVAGATGKAADAGHQHQLVAHDHSTTNKGGQLGVSAVSATGTPSSTTYWRGDNTWATPSGGSSAPDPTDTTQVVLVDEFVGGVGTFGTVGALGWSRNGGGNGLNLTAEAGHPGMFQLTTGSSSGTNTYMWLGADVTIGSILSTDLWDVTFIIRPGQSDTDTTVRVGMTSSGGSAGASEEAMVEKLYADTNWFTNCRHSFTGTRTSSGIAFATGWWKIRIRRIDSTHVGFTIGANSEQQVTTNLPSGLALMPCLIVINQSTSGKSVDIDYFKMVLSGLSR